MIYTLSTNLLSRIQVIDEAVIRSKRMEIDRGDTSSIVGIISEVINDPEDVFNHEIPSEYLTDANSRIEYYVGIATEVAQYLKCREGQPSHQVIQTKLNQPLRVII